MASSYNTTLSIGTVTQIPDADFNEYTTTDQYGVIFVNTQFGPAPAMPINVNNLQVPVPGEIVLLISGPKTPLSTAPSNPLYYICTISALSNINHNVLPLPRTVRPAALPENASPRSVNLESGLTVTNVDIQSGISASPGEVYTSVLNSYLDPSRLHSFVAKDIKPLQHFQGDHLLQSRFGNAIRLSSTHTMNRGSNKSYVQYPYWRGEQENDPFIAITCGIRNSNASNFNIENPDADDSTIMLSSRQRIQKMTLSQPKRVSGFEAMASYANPQIVITSDRLVFNSKQDEILLSGKKTVGIATPGWAMDMNKMFDILEGMLSELAALTTAQATFATGVGPSGPSTNAQAVQELLGRLRNMKQ